MNRRRLLAGAGIALSLPLGGCLSEDENSDSSDDENRNPAEDGDGYESIEDYPRVDEPPHKINSPEGEDPDDWNDEYLGEYMGTEPSLSFEQISVERNILQEYRLTDDEQEEFVVDVVEDESDRDRILDLDEAEEVTRERIEAVDLEESVLVVVETGYGSSSVDHRWARIEGTDEGIHIHGYYIDPYEQLDDITTWLSVLEIERPDNLDLAHVSLTIDEDRRVHFNSTEGVVTPDEDNESGRTSYIAIRNDTAESQTAYLTIRTDEDAVLEETVEVSPDERQLVDSQITATGEYEISLSVDEGPDTSFMFEVDEHALSVGSNVDLVIEEDEIHGVIEE